MLLAIPGPFYGVFHTSLAHITAQVRILGVYVISAFVHFILFDTLGGLLAFSKPLPNNIYLYKIANHINKDIFNKDIFN